MNLCTLWACDTETVYRAFNNLRITDSSVKTTADQNQLRIKLQTQIHKRTV